MVNSISEVKRLRGPKPTCHELSQACGRQLLNYQIFAEGLFLVHHWAGFWDTKVNKPRPLPSKTLRTYVAGGQISKQWGPIIVSAVINPLLWECKTQTEKPGLAS